MKKHLLSLLMSAFVIYTGICIPAQTQEKFDLLPTITGAPETAVCPNDVVVLETQEYDTYQWYLRLHGEPAKPVEGATERSFTIISEPGELFYVSVKVSQFGETAFSEEIIIDQYNPIFYIGGEGKNVWQDSGANIHACEGNFEIFFYIHPSDTVDNFNFQWYQNHEPIENATDWIYQAHETGVYYASANNVVCPDWQIWSMSQFVLIVHDPEPPVITQEGDTLMASWNVGQWFYEEEEIPGATHWQLIPEQPGHYSFEYWKDGCPARSEPYLFEVPTGIDEALYAQATIFPVPAQNNLTIHSEIVFANYSIYDNTGRLVLSGSMENNTLSVGALPSGIYHLQLTGKNNEVITRKFIKTE